MLFFKRQKRRQLPGFLYAGTFLFVFIAAWMIVLKDPHFQALPPVYSYAASFGAACLAVAAEVLRNRLRRKREQREPQNPEP